jgi:hypothetical protein
VRSSVRFLKWLVTHLDTPQAGRPVIVMILVLALLSLFSPLVWDDYILAGKWRMSLDHADQGVSSFLNDCFVFGSGDPATSTTDP